VFLHQLVALEVKHDGESCVEGSAAVRDSGLVGVLCAGKANLDEHVIVVIAEGSGVDLKIGNTANMPSRRRTNPVVAPDLPVGA
jgi:hypothetical protein